MRLFASLRDRPSFTAFTSNNQTIQLPAYASRAIQVTQKIGRGETLMVTGFSDRSAAAGRSGTFDADLPLPEGGRKASTARIEQVLLITADIGEPLGIAEVRGMAFLAPSSLTDVASRQGSTGSTGPVRPPRRAPRAVSRVPGASTGRVRPAMPAVPKAMPPRGSRRWRRRWSIRSRANSGWLWSRAMRLWDMVRRETVRQPIPGVTR